jgi:peroxiredoxin
MATGNRHVIYWTTALFLTLVLTLGILEGCKREKPQAKDSPSAGPVQAITAANKEPAKSAIETAASLFHEPKVSIQNIVKASKDKWSPALDAWWDKPAPDFTLTDIDGQPHKLSDYRGQEVVVVFWATWCGPCKLEVPHLKELRNAFPKEKLAILAISSEPTALVKKFVTDQGINYTVLTSSGSLPTPFDLVKVIPTTFFVGADGKFKLAVEGMVPSADGKAIVQAQ